MHKLSRISATSECRVKSSHGISIVSTPRFDKFRVNVQWRTFTAYKTVLHLYVARFPAKLFALICRRSS